MIKRLCNVLASIGFVMAVSPAVADAEPILYQQQFPDGAGYTSWCSSCSGSYEVFDQFTLSSNSTVGSVDVRIADWYGSNWTVRVDIASDNNWTSPFFNQTFAPGTYTISDPEADNTLTLTFDISDLTLGAAAYELGFYGLPNMVYAGFSGGPGNQVQVQSGSVFQFNNTSGDFTVYGEADASPVPEPTSLLLFGTGAAGLLAKARRRRNAPAAGV